MVFLHFDEISIFEYDRSVICERREVAHTMVYTNTRGECNTCKKNKIASKLNLSAVCVNSFIINYNVH